MKHLNIYNHRRPAQETKLCYETTSDERGRTNSWKESTNANCLANASQGEMEMMNNENSARRIQSQRPKTRKNLFKSPNCPLFRGLFHSNLHWRRKWRSALTWFDGRRRIHHWHRWHHRLSSETGSFDWFTAFPFRASLIPIGETVMASTPTTNANVSLFHIERRYVVLATTAAAAAAVVVKINDHIKTSIPIRAFHVWMLALCSYCSSWFNASLSTCIPITAAPIEWRIVTQTGGQSKSGHHRRVDYLFPAAVDCSRRIFASSSCTFHNT